MRSIVRPPRKIKLERIDHCWNSKNRLFTREQRTGSKRRTRSDRVSERVQYHRSVGAALHADWWCIGASVLHGSSGDFYASPAKSPDIPASLLPCSSAIDCDTRQRKIGLETSRMNTTACLSDTQNTATITPRYVSHGIIYTVSFSNWRVHYPFLNNTSLQTDKLRKTIIYLNPVDNLATKLNSTRSTLLKVDCCRNRQRIGNNVNSTVCRGRLCRQCVRGFKRHALDMLKQCVNEPVMKRYCGFWQLFPNGDTTVNQ